MTAERIITTIPNHHGSKVLFRCRNVIDHLQRILTSSSTSSSRLLYILSWSIDPPNFRVICHFFAHSTSPWIGARRAMRPSAARETSNLRLCNCTISRSSLRTQLSIWQVDPRGRISYFRHRWKSFSRPRAALRAAPECQRGAAGRPRAGKNFVSGGEGSFSPFRSILSRFSPTLNFRPRHLAKKNFSHSKLRFSVWYRLARRVREREREGETSLISLSSTWATRWRKYFWMAKKYFWAFFVG